MKQLLLDLMEENDSVACQVKLPNHARSNFLCLPKPEA